MQLFRHTEEAASTILSVAKNNLNGNFSDFLDLHKKSKNRFGRSCLISLKLQALYFAIIYSRQLSNSSYYLTINIYLYISFYRFLLSRCFFQFPLANACLLSRWRKMCGTV